MMPTAASAQTISVTTLWSTAFCTKTAMARSTTRARIGSSSALGWVRVSTTMDSPSLSRFLEMATDGSCHRSIPKVDYITGAHPGGFAALIHEQPAVQVDAGGGAGQHLARGQVDPDGPPDRRARRG